MLENGLAEDAPLVFRPTRRQACYIVALNAEFLAQLGKTEFENIPNRPELCGRLRASLSA
jgi:hypothetical protein